MGDIRSFFSEEDEALILSAVREAESCTSGEIRVRIEKEAGSDPMAAARKAFESLGMRNTELHNGVLFVLALEDRQFIILGDDGIDQKVPDDFWDSVRDVVIDHFGKGQFGQGLAEGIKLAGEQLAQYFPCQKDDVDELPNAISYADEGGDK
ncbi:MAG: TPM domain-containing protein [Planctomycetes bacterium]|nr:TPM domain-containing protein [Planctomycetota bacterium]